MSSTLANPIAFLLNTVGGLYILVVLLRFLLQWMSVDFYNPLSQAIIKATAPLLTPLRRLIPSTNRFDAAALILAWGLQIVLIYLVIGLYDIPLGLLSIANVLIGAALSLVLTLLNFYIFVIFIVAIASWVAQGSMHPALSLLQQLIEPIASKVRNLIPPMGGLDFSTMVLLLFIYMVKAYFLIPVMLKFISPIIFKAILLS